MSSSPICFDTVIRISIFFVVESYTPFCISTIFFPYQWTQDIDSVCWLLYNIHVRLSVVNRLVIPALGRMKVRGAQFQGHCALYNDFKASLGYTVRSVSKNKTKTTKQQKQTYKCECRYFCHILISVPLGMYLVVGMVDHIIVVVFSGTSTLTLSFTCLQI